MSRRLYLGVLLAALGLAAGCQDRSFSSFIVIGGCGNPHAEAHRQEIEAWRAEREASLRKEDGWLSLVGLFWLEEGENTFGTDPGNDLVFPEGKAPGRAGVLRLASGQVTLEAEAGSGLTHEGQPVTSLPLATDATGKPSVVELGSLLFHVIDRSGRLGVRLKDRESPVLASFAGIASFPLDRGWRIEARLEPYDPPKRIRVPNVLGTPTEETCPGALVFDREGKSFRLEPTGEPGKDLFLVFGDATNGHETYGGGRFLSVPWPAAGEPAVLDFNRAYNPPCVFTPYATCPLPPRQNRLPIRVEAGEKMWGEGGHEPPPEEEAAG